MSGAALALLAGGSARSQAISAPPPAPVERLLAAARSGLLRVQRSGRDMSGPGWDFLVREGREAQLFLLGEEHGVAEIPAVSSALFRTLRPSGYDRVAIEISPPMAALLDVEARGGTTRLKRFFADPANAVAFYMLEPEAAFLAEARAAVPGPTPMLWGLDYEVGADRRLIRELERRAPAGARAAVRRLSEAARASWAEYETSRNPGKMFAFGGDADLVAAVRSAWLRPDAASVLLLDTLEETLRVNAHQLAGRYWQANERRARFNRRNFVRLWTAERASGRTPRVLLKFGGNHLMRGRNLTGVYDVGDLAAGAAELNGGSSFHLLVVPGPESRHARFDPVAYRFTDEPVDSLPEFGLSDLRPQAGQGDVVLDLRPLRPLAGGALEKVSPVLAKLVHGFDAVMILDRTTASMSLLPA
jgi:hypothetical protein